MSGWANFKVLDSKGQNGVVKRARYLAIPLIEGRDMNDKEKALHIGEMWQAWCEDSKCIQYQETGNTQTGVNLANGCNYITLVEHPDRFSIKKEPRFVYVNLYESEYGKEAPPEMSIHATSEIAKALSNPSEYPLLVVAHPIPLPEVK